MRDLSPDVPDAIVEQHLFLRWQWLNERFFRGHLIGPAIRLAAANGKFSGLFSRPVGRPAEIWINRALLASRNVHQHLDNTLLHEMVHQYVEELQGGDEWSHGPRFFTVANRIGAQMGLVFCPQHRLGDWPDHLETMLHDYQPARASRVLLADRTGRAGCIDKLSGVVTRGLPILARSLIKVLQRTDGAA
jgi:hypothetical protein